MIKLQEFFVFCLVFIIVSFKIELYVCVWCSGAYEWAQKTLKDHAKDERPYIYTREQLEKAKTHDKLWNAAQVQH